MEYLVTFVENITDYVLRENITIKDFAMRVGVSPSVVGYWLSLSNVPTVENVIKVADLLDFSIDYLFGLSETSAIYRGSGKADFLERFELLRKEKGLTYHRLSKQAKVGYTTVEKWKQGRYVKIESLIKLANYFQCSIDYLVGRSDFR